MGASPTLVLLDADGSLISGPTGTTAPFNKNSRAVALAGGDVLWTYAERELKQSSSLPALNWS